jgi:hypothetical protein
MAQFSYTEIQKALNKIAQMHSNDDNFVSVEFTDKEEIKVRYLNISKKSLLVPLNISLLNENGEERIINISSEEGPNILPIIGDVEKDLPFISEAPLAGEMGGDQCRNANDMGHYGTISFYAGGLQIDVSGRICNYHCGANSVLVSCNHVIARSDAGGIGEVVWTPFRANVANLACILPLGCEADLALAKFSDPSNIQLWTIRTIGRLNNVRNPVIGEAIKKYGARTGYTTGTIISQAVVNTGSHVYHNAFKTSGGFSCPGDSGSSIVASNNDLLGVLSWGDNIPCEQNPAGYFWIFDFQGLAKEECMLKISGLQP